jgi:hypothetical protein
LDRLVGLLLHAPVAAADVQDRDGGVLLLHHVRTVPCLCKRCKVKEGKRIMVAILPILGEAATSVEPANGTLDRSTR